ncbi:hypothetical protein FHS51_002317 [Sphingobium wenxiniae]|uniref:Uncharacterized protein n=2 Tax=Sphingobium TaxID=165695 RepID=T0GNY0_9SPHN|nr:MULTISPECIES: hypothetical protein [Sphingobium]EQB02387.1 hypothetical protein L485_07700 [Sphingobium baderi LL03]KMS60687.1 hypothetical protein V475_18420 [Sphingobium baderi LL03]MBB6192085.1 hypothetical protein [Sphingobium wenxiniae]TWH92463.1 hypothetical protein IQ35_02579 [Sphingobium wenxiniae]WRD75986.1 hypothetical protein QQ987_14580 [Sphingobium baderi]
MDSIETAFAALSHRMSRLSMPVRAPRKPEPIASLLARVDAAKRGYVPDARR